MAIWLDLLALHGVEEVLVNTHHLAGQVQEFVQRRSGRPKVTLVFEETLLGSAGTIATNWDFVADEEEFLVCYADNLTDIDLGSLIQFHHGHRGLVTMALFRTERPRECGIVELDSHGAVVGFEEKPAIPKSAYANAGVYVMRSGIRSRLPGRIPSDIGFDLLPQCLGELHGWLWEGLLMDIGNPLSYARAQELWARGRESTAALQR